MNLTPEIFLQVMTHLANALEANARETALLREAISKLSGAPPGPAGASPTIVAVGKAAREIRKIFEQITKPDDERRKKP